MIFIGIQNLGKVNTIAMIALFIMAFVLCVVLWGEGRIHRYAIENAMSMGAAIELGIAMPLSWLPLISDYTKTAKKPLQATAVSAATYGIVSSWMYIIGMSVALYTGGSDIVQILMKAGLGTIGLVIVIISTVTTTFMDAYSAGVSGETISKKIKSKWAAMAVTIIGVIGAICFPLTDITDFLYFIGSVFAPMIAIQIVEFFVLKNLGEKRGAWNGWNLMIWVVGFVIYRLLIKVDCIIGSTIPDMLITGVICVIVEKVRKCKV